MSKQAEHQHTPILLSIAGSDSGGGAGIQADLKTFAAHQVFGTTAIVALTAQNTLRVGKVEAVSEGMIEAQLAALFEDLVPAAIKVGMLGSVATVHQIAYELRLRALPRHLPIVIDPVMVATSGDLLLEPESIAVLKTELLPLATVITPNRHEAALLTELPVDTLTHAEAAAEALSERAPQSWVLVKGLRKGAVSMDLLRSPDGSITLFGLPWLEVGSTHGTGCTLSSAIAVRLAQGRSVPEAVRLAKAYVHAAIAAAPKVGQGHGPLWHAVPLPD